MANQIQVTVGGRKITWEMTLRYDIEKTAFIWVEDQRSISRLVSRVTPRRNRSYIPPRGTIHGPKKLYFMKPCGLATIPEWCPVKQMSEQYEQDTHNWMEIESTKEFGWLYSLIPKPVAVVADESEWMLGYEDDHPRQSFLDQVVMNFQRYGLRSGPIVDSSPFAG